MLAQVDASDTFGKVEPPECNSRQAGHDDAPVPAAHAGVRHVVVDGPLLVSFLGFVSSLSVRARGHDLELDPCLDRHRPQPVP